MTPFMSLVGLNGLVNAVGVAALAASGALALGRRSSNLGSALMMGLIAGLVGITLRDLVLRSAVSAVAEPVFVAISAAGAGAVWAVGPRSGIGLFLWLDALGLALMTASSTAAAAAFGLQPLPCLVLGALGGSVSGLARDVSVGDEPLLFRGGVYASAAIVGAAVFVLLRMIGASFLVSTAFCIAATLVLRASAIPALIRHDPGSLPG